MDSVIHFGKFIFSCWLIAGSVFGAVCLVAAVVGAIVNPFEIA
jgi:hypothetical protein